MCRRQDYDAQPQRSRCRRTRVRRLPASAWRRAVVQHAGTSRWTTPRQANPRVAVRVLSPLLDLTEALRTGTPPALSAGPRVLERHGPKLHRADPGVVRSVERRCITAICPATRRSRQPRIPATSAPSSSRRQQIEGALDAVGVLPRTPRCILQDPPCTASGKKRPRCSVASRPRSSVALYPNTVQDLSSRCRQFRIPLTYGTAAPQRS